MNLRQITYMGYLALRGSGMPAAYRRIVREDEAGVPADYAERALSRMLDYCRTAVPHYRGIMQEVEDSPDDSSASRLARLPILTKHDLRSNFDALKAEDLDQREWTVTRSGGSTGQPVTVIQDKEFDALSMAVSHLFSRWAGREIGESLIYLWGSDRDVFRGSLSWKARVFNGWQNVRFLNAFRMTPDGMREFIDVFNTARPTLIVSYAQAIYELASFAEKNGIRTVPQTSIMTSAGTLYPFMRDTIERVFQCHVFNRYGTREVAAIASQCNYHAGLHVSPWTQYIEVVDDSGQPVPPGDEGRIIITSLANYSMPLIRYEIGDRGALEPASTCSCGRAGQILRTVSGRVSDNFRTASGKVIPGEYFIHLIGVVLNTGAIERFQVIQHSYDEITVRVVAVNGFNRDQMQEIEDKIKVVMGQSCAVKVECLDDIPPTPSGKYLYTISEVSA